MSPEVRTKSPVQPESAGAELARLLDQATDAIANRDYQAAAKLLTQGCARAPQSVELHVHAALVLRQSGDLPQAERHFLKAHHLDPKNLEILHNLAIIATEQQLLEKAKEYLHRALLLESENGGVVNDLAVLEEQSDNDPAARLMYERGLKLPSASKRLFQNYFDFCRRTNDREGFERGCEHYTRRWGRDQKLMAWQEQGAATVADAKVSVQAKAAALKLAFFATNRMFIDPVIERLQREHEVTVYSTPTTEEMRAALGRCDLAWFEWCDQLLIQATKLPKTCKIVCRLHSYEVFTELPRQVDWSKVDHLVFVNRSVQDLLGFNVAVAIPQSVIYDGVDCRRFDIPKNKPLGKKICSIGYINYKKNPALLLYCFKAIHDYDAGYTFHIAGEHQDPRIQVYFAHLLPRLNLPVQFDGWVEDIPAYLRDKDYVISTSLFESFHYSIAEGMASGVLPLIHDWLGAEYLYPRQYIYSTPDDCVRLVQELERGDRRKLGRDCREHVLKNFEQEQQQAKIEQLIATLVGRGKAKGVA